MGYNFDSQKADYLKKYINIRNTLHKLKKNNRGTYFTQYNFSRKFMRYAY